MELLSNVVVTEAPNFLDLGILSVNASDEFNTFSTPLPESEGLQMEPIGMYWIIFLENLQRLE